jgi:hypothetical protein
MGWVFWLGLIIFLVCSWPIGGILMIVGAIIWLGNQGKKS